MAVFLKGGGDGEGFWFSTFPAFTPTLNSWKGWHLKISLGRRVEGQHVSDSKQCSVPTQREYASPTL